MGFAEFLSSLDLGQLRDRLYGPKGGDAFEHPPETVARVLERALDAARPRPRYYVTTPTHIAAALRRVTSTRMLDRILGSF